MSIPFSCSDDNYVAEEQVELSDKIYTPEFHNKSVELLSSKIKKNFLKSNNHHLTQEQLNDYLQVIGYESQGVELDDVNNIIDEVVNMVNGDKTYYDIVEENNNISSVTKDIAKSLPEASIDNLSTVNGFSSLPLSEKELLTYLNNLKKAKEDGVIQFGGSQKRNCTGNGAPISCWEGGALGGGLVGFGLCGPVCAGIGAIVGAVVLSIVGK